MATEDIRDFLTALSAAGVDYIVVGAHALAAHGRVRATGDLDVLVAASPADLIACKRASRPERAEGSPKAAQDEADLVWLLAERERRRKG